MTPFVVAGGGFLLAVLWFDLMFDVQVLRHRHDRRVPDDVLASIAGYYRRVTTTARPMNRVVGLVMAATIGALVAQVVGDETATWVAVASLGLLVPPVALAAFRTFPSAVRLGGRGDAVETQATLARAICRDHLFCLAAVTSVLALQLSTA